MKMTTKVCNSPFHQIHQQKFILSPHCLFSVPYYQQTLATPHLQSTLCCCPHSHHPPPTGADPSHQDYPLTIASMPKRP
jgi:hypothetical protein